MDDARKREFDAIVGWRFDRVVRSTGHLLTDLEEDTVAVITLRVMSCVLSPPPLDSEPLSADHSTAVRAP
jgi:hypothetical protein